MLYKEETVEQLLFEVLVGKERLVVKEKRVGVSQFGVLELIAVVNQTVVDTVQGYGDYWAFASELNT